MAAIILVHAPGKAIRRATRTRTTRPHAAGASTGGTAGIPRRSLTHAVPCAQATAPRQSRRFSLGIPEPDGYPILEQSGRSASRLGTRGEGTAADGSG